MGGGASRRAGERKKNLNIIIIDKNNFTFNNFTIIIRRAGEGEGNGVTIIAAYDITI